MSYNSNRELERLSKFRINVDGLTEKEFRGFVCAVLLNLAASVTDIEDAVASIQSQLHRLEH